jgi:hypothetical protein
MVWTLCPMISAACSTDRAEAASTGAVLVSLRALIGELSCMFKVIVGVRRSALNL